MDANLNKFHTEHTLAPHVLQAILQSAFHLTRTEICIRVGHLLAVYTELAWNMKIVVKWSQQKHHVCSIFHVEMILHHLSQEGYSMFHKHDLIFFHLQ